MTGYFVDSGLLTLLVVGNEDRSLIAKHRRLRGYAPEDYDSLAALVSRTTSGKIFTTPNTLTETSNLLGQHGEPERSRLFARLRSMIVESVEVVVASADASSNAAFERLGLTDAALLEVISSQNPLLTSDARLYLEAMKSARDLVAVNFGYLQSL